MTEPETAHVASPSSVFRQRRFVAILIVVFMLTLTGLLYRAFAEWEETSTRAAFESIATDQAVALDQAISRNIEIVHSVRDLFSASQAVEQNEFKAFVEEPLRRHPDFRAIEWIPRVSAADRVAYENEIQRERREKFTITEREASGRLVPAGPRDEYFPVRFVEPYHGNEVALGFDLNSNSARAAAMEMARDLDHVAFSAPIHLVQDGVEPDLAILMMLPVYAKTRPHGTIFERRAALEGYICGVVLLNKLGEASMSSLQHRGVEMAIFDVTEGDAGFAIFERRVSSTGQVLQNISSFLPINDEQLHFSWKTDLDVGGRKWRLVFRPTLGFLRQHRGITEELILIGGILFSTLLAVYLGSSIRHGEEIEVLIKDLSLEIVERRRTEEALRLAAETARNSAAEMERLNIDLQEMNVRLQELDRLKSDFLATVSHELRTPVATIRGAVENQLAGIGGSITDHQRRHLEIVYRSAARLGRLIENLLDMTRLDAGRFSIRTRDIDLRQPIIFALESLKPLAEKERKLISAEIPQKPVIVTADQDRMIQVVTNLLDNALRFATSRVVLSLVVHGGRVEIRVEDDGHGVPPEDAVRIFERFVTRDAIGSKSHMGLGLSIVKAIVEAHGGRVSVEIPAREGGGAVFVVSLPVGGP